MARPDLTGVLLVGGASSRFGSPKALARLDGETLAERAWNLLGEACAERLAVGKASGEIDLPFEVLDDGTETRAALAGIVAGLGGEGERADAAAVGERAGVAVAVIETRVAKLRLFRVPELLGLSFVLALLAVTSSFLLR